MGRSGGARRPPDDARAARCVARRPPHLGGRVSARAFALAALIALAPPALAQQGPRPRPATPAPQQAAPAPPAPTPEPPPPPYEPQLLRLSQIMGSLAFLRELCGARDGDAWRLRMTALLEAEATTEARKERLAGAYNRGYRGFELTYRACTPAAETAIARYLAEGGRIARDLAGRFSGG
ncbi:MAG: TIGR02301 family protein [Rhizobiales bacterium]|nr:TIGR02301 family protein [Hyphomicrobiales bacterium]